LAAAIANRVAGSAMPSPPTRARANFNKSNLKEAEYYPQFIGAFYERWSNPNSG
jgi:hypothetical protein